MRDETAGIWARRWIAEGIGTFFLVLIGPGAAMVNAYTDGAIGHAGIALAFAFVVLAMIYTIGHLSGAHINPASPSPSGLGPLPGQGGSALRPRPGSVGAVLASLVLLWFLGPVGNLGATIPAIPLGAAFAVEFLLSFVLMFVIMAVATDERVADGFAGLAVGLTVGFDAMMGGPLTGASMNPARTLGPAVAGGIWTAHRIYWLVPIAGTIAAAKTYEFLHVARPPQEVPKGLPIGVQGPLDGEHPHARSVPEAPRSGAIPPNTEPREGAESR